jgi:hypothetical protein
MEARLIRWCRFSGITQPGAFTLPPGVHHLPDPNESVPVFSKLISDEHAARTVSVKLNCQSGLNLTLDTMPDLIW